MDPEKEDQTPKRQAIRAQIDENLKRVYAEALSAELPDRFKDLLAQLKAGGAGASVPDAQAQPQQAQQARPGGPVTEQEP